MKKVLWVGDDPDCTSGFGLASRKIIESLDYRQRGEFDVTVLAINYTGDPPTVPYPVYAAAKSGDTMGVNRLIWMCDTVKPDLIVFQNDGWNIPDYIKRLKMFKEYQNVPTVAVVAVDGKNFQGAWLKDVWLVIFWTQFALDESRAGNYDGEGMVIPLGVDREVYQPIPKQEARLRRGLPREFDNAFIVGSVNRNQPRKRWDLTIRYFANWIHKQKITDAWLYLHVAPTGDMGINVEQLTSYYGIHDRVLIMETKPWYGVSEQEMSDTYNSFDIYISTTQGEGFGLPALEAMACGVPCVLPDWSAFGDWAKRGAWLVPCKTTAIGPPYVNVIGGIPDETAFVMAMNRLYADKNGRTQNATAALECAQQPAFDWRNIGKRWNEALQRVLAAEVATV